MQCIVGERAREQFNIACLVAVGDLEHTVCVASLDGKKWKIGPLRRLGRLASLANPGCILAICVHTYVSVTLKNVN